MLPNESTITPLIFRNEGGKNFFEFISNDWKVSIEYKMYGQDRIALINLMVPSNVGEDVSNALIERVLDYAHRSGYKIIPICSFITRFIRKNHRYQKLVIPSLNQKI